MSDILSRAIIRPARPTDIDTIAHLWEKLVAFHRSIDVELPPAAPNGALRYARRLIDHLDDPSAHVLVAEVDGQVVGYTIGVVVDLAPEMFEQEASGFLADIFVDERYRRYGLGKALVAALGDWFRAQGLRYFEWHAAARNLDGIAFWEALGGRPVMLRMRADLTDAKDGTR
ncbi:MAG: GNAT family N-acetyltransferase [Candidatus Flexifilum sp.]